MAHAISVPPRRINEIVFGTRAITAHTASRLGCFFLMGSEFWLNLQSSFDLEVAKDKLAERLNTEVCPLAARGNGGRCRRGLALVELIQGIAVSSA